MRFATSYTKKKQQNSNKKRKRKGKWRARTFDDRDDRGGEASQQQQTIRQFGHQLVEVRQSVIGIDVVPGILQRQQSLHGVVLRQAVNLHHAGDRAAHFFQVKQRATANTGRMGGMGKKRLNNNKCYQRSNTLLAKTKYCS